MLQVVTLYKYYEKRVDKINNSDCRLQDCNLNVSHSEGLAWVPRNEILQSQVSLMEAVDISQSCHSK